MDRVVVPITSVAAAAAVADLAGRGVAVVGVAVDVGQGAPLEALRDAALAAGALRCHVFERRDRLADAFLWPALRIGAVGVDGEPIVTALSAPCVAETAVDVARIEGAGAVAAADASPRARQRLHAAVRGLAPDLGVVAVAVDPDLDERNAWAHVRPLGVDDLPSPPAVVAGAAPPARLTIGLKGGVPVALNGVAMTPAALVDAVATIARVHGVPGHVAAAGADAPGTRWRVHAPAAVALDRACAAVGDGRLDEPTRRFLSDSASTYARLVRDGRWFSPLRGGCDALAAHVFADVAGEVMMTMQHGRIEVTA